MANASDDAGDANSSPSSAASGGGAEQQRPQILSLLSSPTAPTGFEV